MDDADRAQEDMERAMHKFQQQHSRRKHAQNMTSICAECGDPIEVSRLKAVPYATRCIECELFFQSQQKKHTNV